MKDEKNSISWKSGAVKTLRIFLIVYLSICCGVYFLQAKLVFVPTAGEPHQTPQQINLEFEDLRIKSGTEEIHAWFVPADNAKGTVLFCHGNAGNLGHRLETIQIWNSLGMNIMLFDYQGFGSSTGAPSELACYADVQACYNWLNEKSYLNKPLIFHGRSLGGGVATWAAENLKNDGLILESTFTSIPDMGAHIYPFLPVKFLSTIKFPNFDRVQKLKRPILIFHGVEDEVIPYVMGAELARITQTELVELQGGHNNGFLISPDYIPALKEFVRKITSETREL